MNSYFRMIRAGIVSNVPGDRDDARTFRHLARWANDGGRVADVTPITLAVLGLEAGEFLRIGRELRAERAERERQRLAAIQVTEHTADEFEHVELAGDARLDWVQHGAERAGVEEC